MDKMILVGLAVVVLVAIVSPGQAINAYSALINYGLGGAVAVILFVLMYQKSSAVANSGSKAKMATFSIAPALLVIVSILAATAAFNFAVPRLQNAVTSAPVVGAVQAGGVAVQAIDQLLAAPAMNTGGMANVGIQPLGFASSVQQPIVPSGGGWLGGSLDGVAPGSMFTFPTVEPEAEPTAEAAQPVSYPQPTVPGTYTVQRGDSMFKIAAKFLGDGNKYVELCAINRAIVGASCQLTPGMVLKLSGVNQNRNYVAVQDDYQPLVLQSAADRQGAQQPVIQQRVQQVIQAQPTAIPLIFEAARNTAAPTPTSNAITIPYANEKSNMPLVLMAAQD